MEQAKYYVCSSCMTPVPSGHKFCGRCGSPVPEQVLHMHVAYFSDMQNPEHARLVVIRGDDAEGLSYHLKASEHIIGRSGGHIEFPTDEFVSPTHANLFYRDGRLHVRDEQSTNGVFLRVRGTVDIAPGDLFIAGEQIFRLDLTPNVVDAPEADGTFFYASPRYLSPFRVNQILEGGALGMTACTRTSQLRIGREDGELNFPGDLFMSARHCTIDESNGRFTLTDHGSRNGTYIRMKSETALGHGDYVFVGRKLMRIETNVN